MRLSLRGKRIFRRLKILTYVQFHLAGEIMNKINEGCK